MTGRVAVIGAGAAGLAAAWSAHQAGAEVRLLDPSVGASGLAGGAVDDRPWDEVARATEVLGVAPVAGTIPADVRAFADAFGLWRLPADGARPCRLATEAGRVRLARGADRALLDLAQLPRGARVALPRCPRPEWDADGFARALAADVYCTSRGIALEAVDASLFRRSGEQAIGVVDFAERHDDAERLGWLGDRLRRALRDAGGGFDAVLVGPWLGADEPQGEALSDAVGCPTGEILGLMGGSAGARFEAARDALAERLAIAIEPVRAVALRRHADDWQIELSSGDPVVVDAVVIACGGIGAGGIVYQPTERGAGTDIATRGRPPFAFAIERSWALEAEGKPIEVIGSMHGPALDEVAWPVDADPGLLEAVGLACEGLQVKPGVFAAGDVVADRPRTLLQAVHGGVRAGRLAAAVE